jgi:CheY-like chemotaxis protein
MAISLYPEPAPVYAKQKQIEAIIRDLSTNVRRNFPSGSLGVKTELTSLGEEFCRRCEGAQAGPYVELSVGDPGGGAAVSELFADPLFMAMQAGESAAMGLAATHTTVAQCGGFIVAGTAHAAAGATHAAAGVREPGVASSHEPGGDPRHDTYRVSNFHVFLPCAVVHSQESGVPAAPDPAGEVILLVEDEPLIRELSRDMLERQGYRVILAANAKEAEQLGGSAPSFDLLITDAVMPNITGAELARRLRASHPGLKVLIISGYTDNPSETEENGTDGAAFLQKPFSADSLGRKIRQMLSRT